MFSSRFKSFHFLPLSKRIGSSISKFATNAIKFGKREPQVQKPELAVGISLESWNESIDPTGWHAMELYEGAQVTWDGKSELKDRNNYLLDVPPTFASQFPNFPIDGVLWCDKKVVIDEPIVWGFTKFIILDPPSNFEDIIDIDTE